MHFKFIWFILKMEEHHLGLLHLKSSYQWADSHWTSITAYGQKIHDAEDS